MKKSIPWIQIGAVSVAAVAFQIVVVVLAMFLYGMMRLHGSSSPAAMAPHVGRWLGPASGLLATATLAYLVARCSLRACWVGLLVGLGSALVDALTGVAVFRQPFQVGDLYFLGARTLSGVLGGWAACGIFFVERKVVIDCSPHILWKCLTELELLKKWITELEDEVAADSKETGVGVRSTMVMREGSKLVSYETVITHWAPDRRLAVSLQGGSFPANASMLLDYQLEPVHSGATKLVYAATLPLLGSFRLLLPLIYIASSVNLSRDLKKLSLLAGSLQRSHQQIELRE